MRKTGTIAGAIIAIAAILVVIHLAVQELAVILRWSWDQRMILLFVGLALDLVFTVDFLVRSYFALLHRRMGRYFFRERGWIDFLASIPILLLISGPPVLAAMAGTATIAGLSRVANVIEITKAVRIGRGLRLLRVLKLFPVQTEDDYGPSSFHRLLAAAVCSIAILGFLAGLAPVWINVDGLEARAEARFDTIVRMVDEGNLTQPGGQAMLSTLVTLEPDLLAIHDGERRVYSRHSAEYHATHLGPQDYLYLQSGSVGLFFDIRPIHVAAARANLSMLVMILGVLLVAFATPRRNRE